MIKHNGTLVLCVLVVIFQVYGNSKVTTLETNYEGQTSLVLNEIPDGPSIQTSNTDGPLRIRRNIIGEARDKVKTATDTLKWIKNNFRYMFLMFAAIVVFAATCTVYRRCMKDGPANYNGDDGVQVVIINKPQGQTQPQTKTPPPPPPPPPHSTLKQPSRPPPPKRSKPTRPPRLSKAGKGPANKGMGTSKTQGKAKGNNELTKKSDTGGSRCYGNHRNLPCGDESMVPLLIDYNESLDKNSGIHKNALQVPSASTNIKVPFTGRQFDSHNWSDAQLAPGNTRNIHEIEQWKSKDESNRDSCVIQDLNLKDPQESREMPLVETSKHNNKSCLESSNIHAVNQSVLRVIQDQLDPRGTHDIQQLKQPINYDASNLELTTTSATSQHDPRIIHDAIPLSCFMSYQQLADDHTQASYIAQYINEMRDHAVQLHAKDEAIVTNTCVDAGFIAPGVLYENDCLDKSLWERQRHYFPLASTDTHLPITATVK